jgi:glycosyltransferase involved in cell wall biosynthesis
MITFSIIVPTFNRSSLINFAIESILKQTYSNWDLIVVDDGSTDNTREIVHRYVQDDSRIKYIYQENAERCVARNNGINNASGEYICFLDSDDYFLNNRLELLAKTIETSNVKEAVFYTAIRFEEKGIELFVKDPGPVVGNVFDFLYKAVIGTPQLCISKSILMKHHFDRNYTVGEDYELLNRIAKEDPVIYLPNQTTVVACEHEGRTADLSHSYIKHIEMLEHVIKDVRPPFSTNKIPNIYRHDAYLGLARSYLQEGEKLKMLKTVFVASQYAPFHSFKEKCLLILTSFLVFRPFIFIYKYFKK